MGAAGSLPVEMSTPVPPPPIPRLRSGDGSMLSALASILPRRWSNGGMRRTLSGAGHIPEEVEEEATATCQTEPPASDDTADSSALTGPLCVYGLLDGKVFVSSEQMPHRSSTAASAARLLWDDAESGVPSPPLSSGSGEALCIAPVLKSPVLMTQTLLWTAIVDALRSACTERAVGAHPVTLEVLRAVLQAEGPQVTRAKAKAREEGRRTCMAFASSWIVASQPSTDRAPALEHAPPRMRRIKQAVVEDATM